ncbi:MAG: dihydroorotate dehydrogenase [Eubacteriales bacterium]|nr:dihydroorotate dehydrogenase [Eubacteriales bacterium]
MSYNPLSLELCGVSLKNPVIAASGTFGFGREYAERMEVSRLGGICGKGLTLRGSAGNAGERVYETRSSMLNSIGLENPGVKHFVEHEAAFMRSLGPAVIANLGGHSEADYLEGAELLNEADIDLLELNISCPNVKAGGMAFGILPETAADITRRVKAISRHPLMVKLSPNAPDLTAVARACEEAGADALSLVNTFLGMAIDVKRRRPVFDNVYAGLSGPAIFPLALRMVHQVCKSVSIPVVGMGGIASAEDAIRMILAGARAVQVGTMTFASPNTLLEIIDGLSAWCAKERISNLQEICGII